MTYGKNMSIETRRKESICCTHGQKKNICTHKLLVRKRAGQKPLQRLMQRLGNNTKIHLKEIRKVVDRAGPAQNSIQWWTYVNTQTYGKILYQLNKYQFLRKSSAPCSH